MLHDISRTLGRITTTPEHCDRLEAQLSVMTEENRLRENEVQCCFARPEGPLWPLLRMQYARPDYRRTRNQAGAALP